MNSERIYIGFLILSVLVFIGVELLKPKPIDWSDDYTRTQTIPYATKILFDEIESLFPGESIGLNEQTLYFLETESFIPQNRIFINSTIAFDRFESMNLLDRVEKGDQVFLAGTIRGFLADTLNLEFDYYYNLFDSTFTKDSIKVSINSRILNLEESWNHDSEITFNYITSYDSSRTTELGSWEDGELNFIRTDIGEGSIYLNSNPTLFTNYYLRRPDYARYAFTALSHLPVQTTIWDAYYKDGKRMRSTPLYVILRTKYLRQAWYLGLISLLLFMIFKARRRQRIIPIITSPENSTLEFTRTIGLLYLEQGNHKEILEKKIHFFFDYIKNHMRLDTTVTDEKFMRDLSLRSGVPEQEIVTLFDLIELTKNSNKINDAELKTLTDRIDQFYKNSRR